MARLRYRDDLRAALNFVDSALDAEPGAIDALELRALIRARLGDRAAADDAERLLTAPTPHRLDNAASALAVLAETAREPRLAPRALAVLAQALDAGFPASEAEADPDWQPLRKSDEFRDLIRRAQTHRPPKS